MNYPRLKTYLTFSHAEDGTITVTNYLTSHETELTPEEYRFAKKLDGKTDPRTIPTAEDGPKARDILRFLKEENLITESKFVEKSFLDLMYSVWFPKRTKRMIFSARIYTLLLRFLWLPVFAAGLYSFLDTDNLCHDTLYFLGIPLGLVTGMIFHELSHAMTGFAYGARIYEAGVMLRFLMPAAYVLLDESPVRSRMNKCRIFAAGVETNLLLSGIFFFLCITGYEVFFFAAIDNIIMALINLLFIPGLDGFRIITTAMGDEDLAMNALSVISCSSDRRHLRRKGISGKATAAAYLIFGLSLIAYPAVFLLDILSWVEVIFL